ncbi:hypothetical protein [Marinobacterium litorale]|uniref:hypothetical protein n=1 Tax=Marinobacterium litorale TaxID=404770 RepID=UPI0003FAA397|nr:hypothetical protein [Marinobacterium litorale]
MITQGLTTEAVRKQMIGNVLFAAHHDDAERPVMLAGNIELCIWFGISADDLREVATNLKCDSAADVRKAAERMAIALEDVE